VPFVLQPLGLFLYPTGVLRIQAPVDLDGAPVGGNFSLPGFFVLMVLIVIIGICGGKNLFYSKIISTSKT